MIFDFDSPATRRVTDTVKRSADAVLRANEVGKTLTDVSIRNFGKLTIGMIRQAERVGTVAGQSVLQLAERKAPVVSEHEAFRSRLTAFEQAVQQMGPEIITPGGTDQDADYSMGVALGLRWTEIAKSEPITDYWKKKSDASYANDFAYVLLDAELSQQDVQQIVIGMHDHFLQNGGTMSVPGEYEPTLNPSTT